MRFEIIPHKRQRYDTCGDWYLDALGELVITASECADLRSSVAVLVHEAVEAMLCIEADVTPEDVDAWDVNWDGDGEPGDHPMAPYHTQHRIATCCEAAVAASLGLSWPDHERNLEFLRDA